MQDARLTIYAVNIDADDRRLAFVSNTNAQLIPCNSPPKDFATDSLCLLFAHNSQSPDQILASITHYPREQILLIVDPKIAEQQQQTKELQEQAPWLKVVAPSSRLIDEAWSQVLRTQLSLAIEKVGNEADANKLAISFLASALAQLLRRDLNCTRETIACVLFGEIPSCQEPWPANLTHPQIISATASLALLFQDKNEEEFRTRLREISAQIPFKLRSELRLATDRCFTTLWRRPDAA